MVLNVERTIVRAVSVTFEIEVPVAIVGGGVCGLIAALAARERGTDALVLERDPLPSGSTALSARLISAAGTRFQAENSIRDSAQLLASDIQVKTKGRADPAVVASVAGPSGPAIKWLADDHGIPFELVARFVYPGHSALRKHGTPNRTGPEFMGVLTGAAEMASVDLITDASVTRLNADDDGRIAGLDIPEMADALNFGHPGKRGDAVR